MIKTIDIPKSIIFQQKEIRRVWYKEQWYFSIINIVSVLTDCPYPRQYWEKMKVREFFDIQSSPIWLQLKLSSTDGKSYATDCANMENYLSKKSLLSKRDLGRLN